MAPKHRNFAGHDFDLFAAADLEPEPAEPTLPAAQVGDWVLVAGSARYRLITSIDGDQLVLEGFDGVREISASEVSDGAAITAEQFDALTGPAQELLATAGIFVASDPEPPQVGEVPEPVVAEVPVEVVIGHDLRRGLTLSIPRGPTRAARNAVAHELYRGRMAWIPDHQSGARVHSVYRRNPNAATAPRVETSGLADAATAAATRLRAAGHTVSVAGALADLVGETARAAPDGAETVRAVSDIAGPAADVGNRPVLRAGMTVFDSRGKQVVWDGPSDTPGVWSATIDLRVQGLVSKIRCDADQVAPVEVARVGVKDPRIQAGKNASRRWPNKAWWVTIPTVGGPRTLQADTKREALEMGAARLTVEDFHAAGGWDLTAPGTQSTGEPAAQIVATSAELAEARAPEAPAPGEAPSAGPVVDAVAAPPSAEEVVTGLAAGVHRELGWPGPFDPQPLLAGDQPVPGVLLAGSRVVDGHPHVLVVAEGVVDGPRATAIIGAVCGRVHAQHTVLEVAAEVFTTDGARQVLRTGGVGASVFAVDAHPTGVKVRDHAGSAARIAQTSFHAGNVVPNIGRTGFTPGFGRLWADVVRVDDGQRWHLVWSTGPDDLSVLAGDEGTFGTPTRVGWEQVTARMSLPELGATVADDLGFDQPVGDLHAGRLSGLALTHGVMDVAQRAHLSDLQLRAARAYLEDLTTTHPGQGAAPATDPAEAAAWAKQTWDAYLGGHPQTAALIDEGLARHRADTARATTPPAPSSSQGDPFDAQWEMFANEIDQDATGDGPDRGTLDAAVGSTVEGSAPVSSDAGVISQAVATAGEANANAAKAISVPPSAWTGVSAADVRRFTLGGCGGLAWAIHSRTGWPLRFITSRDQQPGGGFAWSHAGVEAPDGRIVDVAGAHDPQAWLEVWRPVPSIGEYGDLLDAGLSEDEAHAALDAQADVAIVGPEEFGPDLPGYLAELARLTHADQDAELIVSHLPGTHPDAALPQGSTGITRKLDQAQNPDFDEVPTELRTEPISSALPDADGGEQDKGAPEAGGLSGVAVRWQPTGAGLVAPTGKRARLEANLAAINVLRTLDTEQRYATAAEQEVLAKWSSWGAVPEVFEAATRTEWADASAKLTAALDAVELAAASATTINAHYTDPRVARAMWDAMTRYGIKAGTVLEPGAGAGIFEALAPEEVQMVGVELDPVTARINAALNPGAHVICGGLEKQRLGGREPAFDAVIGNVPFSSVRLFDPFDNPHRASMHNHFVAKALAHTRPGGLVMVLTSGWTMDGKTSTTRAHLASMGHLLGAVRLPTGSMKDAAGTDVVMDLLVLRKYDLDDAGAHVGADYSPHWLGTKPVGESGVHMNTYFHTHPDHVLGAVGVRTGPHGDLLTVTGPTGEDLAARLSSVLGRIVDDAAAAGRGAVQPGPVPGWVTPGLHIPEPSTLRDGHLRLEGGVLQVWDTDTTSWKRADRQPAARERAEVGDLLAVRDAALAVLAAQQTPDTGADDARTTLGRVYDAYRGKYGPITRFEQRAVKVTAAERRSRLAELEAAWRASELPAEFTADERSAYPIPEHVREQWDEVASAAELVPHQPHLRTITTDPGFALLLALETHDPGTGQFAKTEFFTRDLITTTPTPTRAETPAEALTIALQTSMEVDLTTVAGLLGLDDEGAALDALGSLVFTDPADGRVVPAHLYLSGNVRAKHAAAVTAAAGDPAFARNVDALAAIVPADIDLADVAIRPGARWLGEAVHTAFVGQVLADPDALVFIDPLTDDWKVTSASGAMPAHVRMTYGTTRRSPAVLLEAAMNNRPMVVRDTDANGKSYVNQQATALARAAQAKLVDAFAAFVRADEHRAAHAAKAYNEVFNSYLAPDWTDAGHRLALSGLSEAMTPHDHQRAAVARVISSPAVLLDHVVGAGKTGVMVMSAMEMRHLGVAQRPWVVVPNHLVSQVAAEWVRWYPGANVLMIPTGITAAECDQYLARAAVSDVDGVVVGKTTFSKMGISPLRAATWLAAEIDELRQAGAMSEDKAFVKKVEQAIKRAETRHEKLLAKAATSVVSFEQSGCDYLFIDEAHNYKNLARVSGTPDLAHTGSQIASDLDVKLRALREARAEAGHPGAPVVTFATGTPVANALAESWVMTHYLRPDLLADAGIEKIDAWAVQFATVQGKLELGPDGRTWRVKDRVTAFVNLPELVALNNQFTDTITRTDLTVTLPELSGGRRQVISRDASPAVKDFIDRLAYRATNLPSDPSADNLLKITSEGRMVALDPRLMGLPADLDGGRVGQVADQIMATATATADTVYTRPDGGEDPVRGGLQIVFCDRSIPSADGSWNFYDALAAELVSRGMDRSAIAFIHDAKDDEARTRLFDAANSGRLRVLVGSTEKMGTGTNVQRRVVAIHHVDCPWRPADLEQREGRAFRQGNQNTEVSVFSYITTGTYDAVVWQIVERKASFIAQLRTTTARTIEDTGQDLVVSAALAQAIATGDERVLRRAELSEEVTRLETLEAGWRTARHQARFQITAAKQKAEAATATLTAVESLLGKVADTSGDKFALTTPDGARVTSRPDAGGLLLAAAKKAHATGERVEVGVLGGAELVVDGQGEMRVLVASLPKGVPFTEHFGDSWKRADPVGLVRRIENRLTSLGLHRDLAAQDLRRATTTITDLGQALEAEPAFPQQAQLDAARAELAGIDEELQIEAGTTTTITDDSVDLVTGEGLERIMGAAEPVVWAGGLPKGSFVTSRGGRDSFPAGVWQTGDTVLDDATKWVELVQEGEDTTARVRAMADVNLVALPASALDEVTLAALDAPETDQVAKASQVQVGEKITMLALPAAHTQEPAHGGKGRYTFTPARDATPSPVTGKVTALGFDGVAGSYSNPLRAFQLDTGDGSPAWFHIPHAKVGAVQVIRRGVLTAAPTGRTLVELLPGDTAHITGTDGLPHPRLPEVLTRVLPEASTYPGGYPERRFTLLGADGNRFTISPDSTEVTVTSITAGADITDTQGAAVFGQDWKDTQTGDLRPGDRALVCDLNPKAKTNRTEAVITHVAGSGAHMEITYQLPTGIGADIRRRSDGPAPITARRFGALAPAEQRVAATDGARHIAGAADALTLKAGDRVWVQPHKDHTAAGWAGTVTRVDHQEAANSNPPWGAHTPARTSVTITPAHDGEPQTLDMSAYQGPTLTVYPPGAPIPERICPATGTAILPASTPDTTPPAAKLDVDEPEMGQEFEDPITAPTDAGYAGIGM